MGRGGGGGGSPLLGRGGICEFYCQCRVTSATLTAFRPKGIRDGAMATVSPKTGVAFAWRYWGQPWRLWRYGRTKRHGRKPYSIRIRAFVAFVALFLQLDLPIKKEMDDTLHPPADNITAR